MSLAKKIEQKKKAKKAKERNKKIKIATLGVATGAITGILGGVLLAPKSGKETREDIKNTAKDINTNVSEKAAKTKEKLTTNVNESKRRIKEYLDSKKKENEDVVDTNVVELLQAPQEAKDKE
ncbi:MULTISPECIES: YtxH domain-containing protein [Romboutsia]|uniref:YtxH-like protein n=1 Tax=Romboutsia hominis TaxID=1507512 RepID=A0A2P2BSD1_9FIRM|nr:MULTISPECIES: YtxH domain-containing protein [Romboutsia]MCH1960562.1 YtxH domain-containing protein [Romboutsia hominis]MCH1969005.1 YtxH domain-containing protein [Romboutsia hominis]MDB8790254.1 YtxH domain-containing protein [Romboutsia sp. 1001216sp1]MDB8793502.1 YtxH domain-containing protein [Romboutsia sp. 1001216sp1]MDB8797044.1 YtxH domain-containing protein [Romboutsia sp. 1001216sp1]